MEETDATQSKDVIDPVTSGIIRKFVHFAFFWCMGGVSLIYGVRLYHDIPIHPSFIPIIGAAFAAIVSLTLIMALRIYAGPIDFEAGSIKLKGATGPIILWCICFLTVAYGLFLLGIGDVAKAPPSTNYISCSAGRAFFTKCAPQNTGNLSQSKTAQGASSSPQP